MRTRLLIAVVCILILPFAFSTSNRCNLPNAIPFSSVAFAGHTISGEWCPCGGNGCVCDPGELAGGNRPASVNNNESSDRGPSPIRANPRSRPDFGIGALIFALVLLLWARLRG